MATWLDVLANEDAQRRRYAALAGGGSSKTIEDFYPELHNPNGWRGEYANTVGAHLLPQLLTAPRVLVDLYNWQDPAGLINAYGVDLDFLLELRSRGFVKLTANLPVDRYQNAVWLHDVLADPDTIFRSTRTPLFFEALYPEAAQARAEIFEQVLHLFKTFPKERLEGLSTRANSSHPPERPEDFANGLSVWATRLLALRPEEGEQLRLRLLNEPETGVSELRQMHLFAATPITAGLGGSCGIRLERLKHFLRGKELAWSLPKEMQLKTDAISKFLTRHSFGTVAEDFHNHRYWETVQHNRTERLKILEKLEDGSERTRAFNAERFLRQKITVAGQDCSEHDLQEYVDGLIKTRDNIAHYGEFGCIAPVAIVPLIWTGVVEAYAGFAGAAATIAGCAIFQKKGEKLLEKVIPSLQVVNYMRSRNTN